MLTRRQAAFALGAALTGFAADDDKQRRIRLHRVPEGGIQPQVGLDEKGVLHLAYFSGDPHHGDLFYTRSKDGGATFSSPLPVNRGGSAIAAGTIRGAQLALGRAGRVHVAWNGSNNAGPLNPDSGKPGAPMLYTRLTTSGDSFEPERNLMHRSFGLDGGGSIAADNKGNVYVAWHGIGDSEGRAAGKDGEARRRVWLTRSENDGKTFSPEAKAWAKETGACSCCGMKILAGQSGEVFALYRSATESVHRDVYLLSSNDGGKMFQGKLLHKWNVNACPMSSMDLAQNAQVVVAAWETAGQVYWARIAGGSTLEPVAAPGQATGRKHPRVALNERREMLLLWTEGTGWQKGGSFAYQRYDRTGQPVGETKRVPGIPAWSFAAAAATPDGFSIFY
jgi:hypothetical protein